MKLLALDLGINTGWAFGDAKAHPPIIGVWKLKTPAQAMEYAAGRLGFLLRNFLRDHGKPDAIVVEQYLEPRASSSGAATVGQILLHGSLHCICGMAGIAVYPVAASTARKHFCGRAFAGTVGRGKRTSRQKATERAATKAMVGARAKQLGYLPRDCADDNMSDVAAIWDWGKTHVARTSPAELIMFGETDAKTDTLVA